MKKNINDKLTTYGIFGTFIEVPENKAKIAAILETVDDVNNFHHAMDDLLEALLYQTMPTTGLKDETEVARKAMAQGFKKYGRKTKPLALKAGQLNLAKIVGNPKSYYLKGTQNLTSERAKACRKALDDNKAPGGIFTNVQAADIAIIDALIEDFENKKKVPKSTKKDYKTKGTDKIPEITKKVDVAMNNIYGFVYGELIDDDPDFVNEMALTIKMDHTGIRHTGLTVLAIYDQPLPGVDPNVVKGMTVKLVELNISTTTNLFGVGSLKEFVPGTYTLECSGEGLITQNIVVTFIKGRVLQMNVRMKRV